jgi:hypothetical protein
MKNSRKRNMKPQNNKKTSVKKQTTIKAKKAVKKVGAKRLLNDTQTLKLQQLHKSGKHSGKQLSKMFKISAPTLYNYLKVKVKK